MGKFSKAGGREMPELNTSSLPDLVFAFLFFIMMVTSMREVTLKVVFKAPQATELQKLEKKSLVTFIYVGKPTQELRGKLEMVIWLVNNHPFLLKHHSILDFLLFHINNDSNFCFRTQDFLKPPHLINLDF